VGAFIFWTFYSINFNQTNGGNQTNGNEVSFNFHGLIANVNVIAQDLMGKTVLNTVSPIILQQTYRQQVKA